MTERKIFELTISLLTFLKTREKKNLAEQFSRADDIFNLNIKDVSLLIGRSIKVKDFKFENLKAKLERSVRIIENYKIELTSVFDSDYPYLLREIAEPPFMIFSRGKKLNEQHKIAIVGTRRPTGKGMQFAFDSAKTCAEKNYAVVSGLALGVDAFAHKGAVSVNAPTIAVLPCAVENLYPRANVGLARKIIDAGGSIISEYPPETTALKFRFLERNRIVSGISDGTVVIEAPEKSGALSTAAHTRTQGKPLFMFEQLLDSVQNEGGRALSACTVKTVDEIIDVLQDTVMDKKQFVVENSLFV